MEKEGGEKKEGKGNREVNREERGEWEEGRDRRDKLRTDRKSDA